MESEFSELALFEHMELQKYENLKRSGVEYPEHNVGVDAEKIAKYEVCKSTTLVEYLYPNELLGKELKEFDCRDFKETPHGSLGRIKGYAADRSIAHKDMLLMLLQSDFEIFLEGYQIMNRIQLAIVVAMLYGAWIYSYRALEGYFLDIAVIGLVLDGIWSWVYQKGSFGTVPVICFITLALDRVISQYVMKRADLDGWLRITRLSLFFSVLIFLIVPVFVFDHCLIVKLCWTFPTLATFFASLLRRKFSVWDSRYMIDLAVSSAFCIAVRLLLLGFKRFFGCESSTRST